jgi:hypothetical protein
MKEGPLGFSTVVMVGDFLLAGDPPNERFPTDGDVPPGAVPLPMLDLQPSAVLGVGAS